MGDLLIGFAIGAAPFGFLWLLERCNYLAEKRRANALQQRINYILGYTNEYPTEETGDNDGKELHCD